MPTRWSMKRRATLRLRGASPALGLGAPRPGATRAVTLRVLVAARCWGAPAGQEPAPAISRMARRPGSWARGHRRRRITARRERLPPATERTGRRPASHTCTHASAASLGQNHLENSARRGGVRRGSASRRPRMELTGRALATAVRSTRAASPSSLSAATW
jgi:hypothetical protein